MVFNRFAFFMIVRVGLLALSLICLSFVLTRPGYYVTIFLLVMIAVILIYELYRFVSKTNRELARFLDAARYEDFGQRFPSRSVGAGFEELTGVFGDIMGNFKSSRQAQEEQLRHLKSLTEHIPVPLLSLYPDGRIHPHNNAARRLFGGVQVNRIEDLNVFGAEFFEAIDTLEPGRRMLVNFSYDGMERQLMAVMSRIVTGTMSEKLLSLQDIQSELDDVQLHAWRDLTRVLTHEIMNSITPVSSLANTARDLADEMRAKVPGMTGDSAATGPFAEDLEDLRRAVDTVARRSGGLMQFVQSYRSLTQLPEPRKLAIGLSDFLGRIKDLFAEDWANSGLQLHVKVEPQSLRLTADPGLLEQVLINLLKNAEQALAGRENPTVAIRGRLNQSGHVLLEIADNGPGIPADIVDKIFVPFFTTRSGGSGVGLALTRQIMIAHGGNIAVHVSEAGGAKFVLIF